MVCKRIQVASKISILSGEAKKSFTEMTLPHLSINTFFYKKKHIQYVSIRYRLHLSLYDCEINYA